MYTFIEKGVSVVYDTREDLVYLEIGTQELDKAYSCDYSKQELVDILRRLADSLEFAWLFIKESKLREADLYTLKKEKVLVASDNMSEIDKVLKDTLVKNWELTEEKYKIQEQYNSALKTNENLVEYKNDLLRENSTLVEKLFTYTTMSFWKRLVFLFTGKVWRKQEWQ